MSMRHFAGLLLALSTATLAGCNCPDADVAPVVFTLQFSTDTLGAGRGFRTAELRAAYLVRYKDNSFQQLADTIRVATNSYAFSDDSLQFYFPGPEFPPQTYLPFHYPDFYDRYALAQSLVLHIGPDAFRFSDFDMERSKTGLVCPETHLEHYFATLNGRRIDVRGGYLLTR